MRTLTTLMTLAACLALCGAVYADWTGAATIRDESFYQPSSNLTLGAWGQGWVPTGAAYTIEGYVIDDAFQLNLEYQAGISDADIANLNTYMYPADPALPDTHTDGTWQTNFDDEENYFLAIDCTGTGGLPLYAYTDVVETGGAEIQWTLTGWHQTILAGDVIDNGDGTITLRVLPEGTYRPFPNDPPVNNVEIFDGWVDCEVLGYLFTGTCGEIGEGSVLTPVLTPEPATLSLLALGGLALVRRRRK